MRLLTIGTALAVSATAMAQDTHFYVADADSRIYSVNRETLAATEIFQIDRNGQIGVNDILFTGGDTMLANITGQLVQYDMATGVQTTITTISDHYDTGLQHAWGLTRTFDDRIGISIFEFGMPTGYRQAFAAYDPFTGEYEEISSYPSDDATYMDIHQISPNTMLGLNWVYGHVSYVDLNDGSLIDRFEFDFDPVSFLELDGELLILDDRARIYTFDVLTGETESYGSIEGVHGIMIGATSSVAFRIPAPTTTAVFGFGALLATRRRRS